MKQRVLSSVERLKEIQTAVPALAPLVGELLSASETAKVQPNNQAELNSAADAVKAAAKKFTAMNYTGNQLSGLDTLIPDAKNVRGKVSDGK
jgi:hypothetical protein